MHISGSDVLTVFLLVALEGLLSVDNAMVLAVLVLGLPGDDHLAPGEKPRRLRKKALRYGIFGAFAFRIVAVIFALQLIRLVWVKLAGAAYLLYLPYKHFWGGADVHERRAIPEAKPWLGLSPFWATVVRVELTDIVFAIDSVVVAVGMSTETWVVLTGGILGIIMMRVVIGQLLAIVERYPPLVDGAFVIIAWVGLKLLLEFAKAEGVIELEIPRWIALGLIVVIFGAAFVYSVYQERVHKRPTIVEQRATGLLVDGDDADHADDGQNQ